MSVEPDIRKLKAFPKVDLIAAGFPCQDLSQAGRTAGIGGRQSGLIVRFSSVFAPEKRPPVAASRERSVHVAIATRQGNAPPRPRARGTRVHLGVSRRQRAGVRHSARRHRVLLLASVPRTLEALCSDVTPESSRRSSRQQLCGFYWTEGLRGLGWAVDAVPTLKGGSTIGIPSPPAIWDPRDGSITTPDLRDAERLQGFDEGWTLPAADVPGVRQSHRWKLVGNAVSVRCGMDRSTTDSSDGRGAGRHDELRGSLAWPRAAWGHKGHVYSIDVSSFPERKQATSLREFLRFPRTPLSHRAASGFLSRALVSGLRFEDGFLEDVRRHVKHMARFAAA